MYHGGQILNTSTCMSYDIHATCIFSANKTINLRDLKRHIHVGLELLANSTLALVHGSTLPQQVRVVFFTVYLGLFLMKFGE
jgi:hypothetical protein